MEAYEHATTVTKNGFLYIDTSNNSGLREKFRIRNFIAPIYAKDIKTLKVVDGTAEAAEAKQTTITAVAKKDNQYLYADIKNESPTY